MLPQNARLRHVPFASKSPIPGGIAVVDDQSAVITRMCSLDNPHLLLLPRRCRAQSTGGLPRFHPLEPLKLTRK